MFKVYGSRKGQFVQCGDASYLTAEEAVNAAKFFVGHYDALEVRNHNDAVVWELVEARSAPKET